MTDFSDRALYVSNGIFGCSMDGKALDIMPMKDLLEQLTLLEVVIPGDDQWFGLAPEGVEMITDYSVDPPRYEIRLDKHWLFVHDERVGWDAVNAFKNTPEFRKLISDTVDQGFMGAVNVLRRLGHDALANTMEAVMLEMKESDDSPEESPGTEEATQT